MEHLFEDLFYFFLPAIFYNFLPIVLTYAVYYFLLKILEKRGKIVSGKEKIFYLVFLYISFLTGINIFLGAKYNGGLIAFLGDTPGAFAITFLKLIVSTIFVWLTNPIAVVIILALILLKIRKKSN